MGCQKDLIPGQGSTSDTNWSSGNNRTPGVTTVRWPVNYDAYEGTECQETLTSTEKGCPSTGVCGDQGVNNGIHSSHSGGSNVLLGDGSVTFLKDDMDMITLFRMATRDDGQVVEF